LLSTVGSDLLALNRYHPRSNRILFRGLGMTAHIERVEFWDGDD